MERAFLAVCFAAFLLVGCSRNEATSQYTAAEEMDEGGGGEGGGGGGGGVCGNGTQEAGEQCDGGGCCSRSCYFKTAGTVCDQFTGAVCSGSNGACPTNGLGGAGVNSGVTVFKGRTSGGICQ